MDTGRLQNLIQTTIVEMGAAANAALVIVGEDLGLYRAMAALGPATSSEIARAAGVRERYLREWLSAQAASGFVTHDAEGGRFSLSPEQVAVLADDGGPAYLAGGFRNLTAMYEGVSRLTEAFKTGEGIAWGAHCPCLFCGTARFYRTGYKVHLVDEWLPALDGMVDRLRRGARVVDIGCGFGASTEIMATAFPNSEFVGIDSHVPSIDHARAHAGHLPNLRFEAARAQDFVGGEFDLAAMFDAFHDMGDPVGAARHARRALKPDGTLMLVEPMAGDSLAENLNPVGRLFYAASTQLCVPASLSQEVGMALGAQAGEKRIAELLADAGFSRVRRAAATPFNMVIEARA